MKLRDPPSLRIGKIALEFHWFYSRIEKWLELTVQHVSRIARAVILAVLINLGDLQGIILGTSLLKFSTTTHLFVAIPRTTAPASKIRFAPFGERTTRIPRVQTLVSLSKRQRNADELLDTTSCRPNFPLVTHTQRERERINLQRLTRRSSFSTRCIWCAVKMTRD